MNDGSSIPERPEDPDTPRRGISKPLWKALLISLLLFWALDLLTSATLVSQGFGRLEDNVYVRLFFQTPTWHHFVLFVRNQGLDLIPLVIAASAPLLDRIAGGPDGNDFL